MNTPALISRPVAVAAILSAALLSAVGLATASGLILGNATTSVPRGLYRKADPAAATYVTFCLGARHASGAWYGLFCSPDDPGGVRILKRIGERRDGHVIVEGDGPRPLDSNILGPIRLDEIRGWWRPVVQIEGTAEAGRHG